MLYRNLEAELKRKGITRRKLANLLGINIMTVSSKLNGKSELKFDEAKKIAAELDNQDLNYLFEK
jgi:transcriptional regulator with XRE-family HTH domain